MTRLLTFILTFIVNFFVYSQFDKYKLADSALLLFSNDQYKEALVVWEEASKSSIDPNNKLIFLTYAWRKYDTSQIKKTLRDLLRNHGIETEDLETIPSFYNDFTRDTALYKWYQNIYGRERKYFLATNADKISIIQKFKEYKFIDQQIIIGDVNKYIKQIKPDSSISKHLSRVQQIMSMELFNQIIKQCNSTGELPNSFDYNHPVVTSSLFLILLHNTKINFEIENKWKVIWPYLEKACREGKIRTADVLWLYDNSMYWNYGYQYYGMLLPQNVGHHGKIPVKDERELHDRRKKFGLGPVTN